MSEEDQETLLQSLKMLNKLQNSQPLAASSSSNQRSLIQNLHVSNSSGQSSAGSFVFRHQLANLRSSNLSSGRSSHSQSRSVRHSFKGSESGFSSRSLKRHDRVSSLQIDYQEYIARQHGMFVLRC